MKKKILFCMFNMTGGGAERVLVNLFHELPPESYDITLFSLLGSGVNMGGIAEHTTSYDVGNNTKSHEQSRC